MQLGKGSLDTVQGDVPGNRIGRLVLPELLGSARCDLALQRMHPMMKPLVVAACCPRDLEKTPSVEPGQKREHSIVSKVEVGNVLRIGALHECRSAEP